METSCLFLKQELRPSGLASFWRQCSYFPLNFVRGKPLPTLWEASCFKGLSSGQRPKVASHPVIKSIFPTKDHVLPCQLPSVLEMLQFCNQTGPISICPCYQPHRPPPKFFYLKGQRFKFFSLRNDIFPLHSWIVEL